MFDLFTYTIYLSLLFSIILLVSWHKHSKKINDNKLFIQSTKLTRYHYAALLLISFIVGFRYYVGNDWESYKVLFENIASHNYSIYQVEWGYMLLNQLVIKFGGGYTIMFSIVAFISWFFIFKSFDNKVLPIFIFFIFADEYFFWSMNGVRQFVAIGIFLYSINFIIDRNIKIYMILIISASLFHISALLLIPLYFIPYHKLYNQKLWGILFIVSFFFANIPSIVNGLETFYLKVTDYIPLLSTYTRYFYSGKYEANETVLGLGALFRFLITFFIIYFSKEVIKKYPQMTVYFILYFMGAVLYNMFFMFQLIGRFNHYFLIMRSLTLAIVLYHLWKNNKYRLIPITVTIAYFLLFLVAIYNSSNMCSPFNFGFK